MVYLFLTISNPNGFPWPSSILQIQHLVAFGKQNALASTYTLIADFIALDVAGGFLLAQRLCSSLGPC